MIELVSAPVQVKRTDEVLLASVNFTRRLRSLGSTLLLTGTPVITAPAGITVGTPIVNNATFYDSNGRIVAIGNGVQFLISGGTDGESYDIGVACGTTGSPAQTVSGNCPLEVRDTD